MTEQEIVIPCDETTKYICNKNDFNEIKQNKIQSKFLKHNIGRCNGELLFFNDVDQFLSASRKVHLLYPLSF